MTTWSYSVNAGGARGLLAGMCLALVACNSLLGNETVAVRGEVDGGSPAGEAGSTAGRRAAGGAGAAAGGAGAAGVRGQAGKAGSKGQAGKAGSAEGGAGTAGQAGTAAAGEGGTGGEGQAGATAQAGAAAQGGAGSAAGSGGAAAGGGSSGATCASLQCPQHSSCNSAQPKCVCDSGYQGDGTTCTRIDPCLAAPCKNGSTCLATTTGFACNCGATDFSGPTCEQRIDDCASQPCKNGGTCMDLVKDYKCTCTHGWSGKQCTTNSGCDYDNAHYDAGAKFAAGDGCNTCTCEADGTVSCTKNTCTLTCGGIAGKLCPSGQFCNYPVGSNCGASDQQGTCAASGNRVCPTIVQSVCGCDGKTYSNACYAASAGVSVRADGECPSGCDYAGIHYESGASFPASDGCNTCSCGANGKVVCTKKACTAGCKSAADCAAGQYCAWSAAAQCGQAGAGACQAKPDVCTQVYSPVCGCDNHTYSNSCSAAAAGVSVKAQDACP